MLDQAIDDRHPLLERLKFLAIVGSNLDEFFMVRVATLRKRQRANLEQVSPDGLTVSQQLAAIRERRRRDAAAIRPSAGNERLRPALAEPGVRFLETDRLHRQGHGGISTSYFMAEIFPLLTPLAFDPGPSVSVHLEPQQEPRGRRSGTIAAPSSPA